MTVEPPRRWSALKSLLLIASLVALSLASAPAAANTLNFQGLAHTSLGSASLAPAGSNLVISNIGSSGLDGVRVDIQPSALYSMDWLPLDPGNATPNVELLKLGIAGSMGGGPVQSLGSSSLTRGPATEFAIGADFSAAGSGTYGLELYLSNSIVFAQNGLTLPVKASPVDGTDLPISVSAGLPPSLGSPNPGFIWPLGAGHPVTVPGGPTVFSDEIRLLADNAAGSFDFLAQFSVLARDMPNNQIVITGSDSRPVPEPSALAQIAILALFGATVFRGRRMK